MPAFVVFALPRSRTAWLSRFLTHGQWKCGHDEARHFQQPADIARWLSQPNVGSVETAAAPFWRSLPRDCRIAVVRRPVGQVVESLMRFDGFDRDALTAAMQRYDRKLVQISKRLRAPVYRFDELTDEAACASLFEHCLEEPHDSAHWSELASRNIQVDLTAVRRHYEAFRPNLEKLAALLKQQSLSRLSARPLADRADVTLQAEDFDTWRRDGAALFADHCAAVGELPDEWQRKNWPLWRSMYDAGLMQIMTARSNGRMFGYLVTFIYPSMTSESVTSAANTLFFGSEDMKGVGARLQRASLDALAARGVNEVFWEAGQRGSGPKLGALYKRLGAVEHGRTYRMELH